jgi:two-component system response regulator YesN
MKNSDKTIYMIAEDVGFSDYKYFIKVFSKYTETTPLQFMQHINR